MAGRHHGQQGDDGGAAGAVVRGNPRKMLGRGQQGKASAEEIDEIGIVPATALAMRRALDSLALMPQFLLIDAFPLPDIDIPQKAIVKGDALSLSIAAASIVAKVTRDRIMAEIRPKSTLSTALRVTRATAAPSIFAGSTRTGHALSTGTRSRLSGTPAIHAMTTRRQRTGELGEEIAARRLREAGYRILERKHRTPHGEIDLVCERDGTLIFVEVRTRRPSGFGSPEESITPAEGCPHDRLGPTLHPEFRGGVP